MSNSQKKIEIKIFMICEGFKYTEYELINILLFYSKIIHIER